MVTSVGRRKISVATAAHTRRAWATCGCCQSAAARGSRGCLHHPEGCGVDRRQAEAESPGEGQQAHQPRAQTSRTWHRVSSGSCSSPEGQAGL